MHHLVVVCRDNVVHFVGDGSPKLLYAASKSLLHAKLCLRQPGTSIYGTGLTWGGICALAFPWLIRTWLQMQTCDPISESMN